MCDTNGRPRGRTGSPYVARLTAAGTQLQPCNRTRGGFNSIRFLNFFRNMSGMMCDTNGRPRGRTGSPYVARLTGAGTQLQPCNRTRVGRGIGVRFLNFFRNITGMMCDTTGRPRGRTGSPYVARLTASGTQLQPCNRTRTRGPANWLQLNRGPFIPRVGQRVRPGVVQGVGQGVVGEVQAARASDPGSSEFATSSSSSSMVVGGIVLVIVGVMFVAVLIVLNIRLAQLLRA